jgi:hypothetical protein
LQCNSRAVRDTGDTVHGTFEGYGLFHPDKIGGSRGKKTLFLIIGVHSSLSI